MKMLTLLVKTGKHDRVFIILHILCILGCASHLTHLADEKGSKLFLYLQKIYSCPSTIIMIKVPADNKN